MKMNGNIEKENSRLSENHCFTTIIYPEKTIMTIKGCKEKFTDLLKSGVIMVMLTDNKTFADETYRLIIDQMKEFLGKLEEHRIMIYDQSTMEKEFEKSLKDFKWMETFLLLWKSRFMFNEAMSGNVIHHYGFPVEQRVFEKTGNHCVLMATHFELLEKDTTILLHNFINFLEFEYKG
jgi:hypothetical protein